MVEKSTLNKVVVEEVVTYSVSYLSSPVFGLVVYLVMTYEEHGLTIEDLMNSAKLFSRVKELSPFPDIEKKFERFYV